MNQEELVICRRRGHEFRAVISPLWSRCKWCGVWVRTVSTVEEREDDPPEAERDPSDALRRKVEKLERNSPQ